MMVQLFRYHIKYQKECILFDNVYAESDVNDIQKSNFNNHVEKMPFKSSETGKDKLEGGIVLYKLKCVVTNSKKLEETRIKGIL